MSPELQARQRERIAARFPADLHRFEWIDRLPQKIRGLVIANEVLDVVPFALVFRTHAMKTPAGRARKIAALVAMLARGETIYPNAAIRARSNDRQ